jgi:hypothetical protein
MRISLFGRAMIGILLSTSFVMSQYSLRPAIQSMSAQRAEIGRTISTDGQPSYEKKSVLVAIVYSLVLPGLGDLYADNFQTGKYFLGADAGLWVTFGALRTYGNWLKQDAQTFAVDRASANFDGKGDQFAVDIGNYENVADYNAVKLRNRDVSLVYDPNSTFAWQWTSDADRAHYKDLRIRGDAAVRNSQFVVGALVLNRIVSAISAARSVSLYNRRIQTLGSWRLRANVSGGDLATQKIELTLSRDF